MTTVTINGNTYSADGSSPKDMQNGGHRTHFLPLCADVAAVAGIVAGQAEQTAIDAANAANGAAATRGTSTTSLTVGAGVQALTTQAGKQFTAGSYVTISRTSAPTTLMHGVVTAYSGVSLSVDASTVAGSGTFTDWTIALSGAKGNTGATGTGDIAYIAKTAAYTVLATDKGKLIDCTAGTFVLSFSACATLGANWATYIRNSGTGVITLDPNGSEAIDGVATLTLNPGASVLIQCDGSTFRKAALHQYDRQYLHVREERASGVAGGTSISGENVRPLNTVIANTITGASMASGVVSLPPGAYKFEASAVTYSSAGILSRLTLYSHTDSSDAMTGLASNSAVSMQDMRANTVSGQLIISAAKSFKLNHYMSDGTPGFGLGRPLTTGQSEIYADLKIWRVA